MGPSEAQIQYDILIAWGAHPRLRIWRQNTGAAKINGSWVKFGVKGCPDILGLMAPSGRLLGIEVKTATGKQSDDQKRFQAILEKWGGLYVLARSVGDVDRALGAVDIFRAGGF